MRHVRHAAAPSSSSSSLNPATVDTASVKRLKAAAKAARKKARRVERALAQQAGPAEGSAGVTAMDIAAARRRAEAATAAAEAAAVALTRETLRAPQTFPPCIDVVSRGGGGVDLVQGLVLHREAVTEHEEQELIRWVLEQCERGRRGDLRKPTYLRTNGARSLGNTREMLMYGGFFDFNRARPGKRGLVPPFPPILNRLVKKLVDERGLLPKDVRPDSCIINAYSPGDCIPPHTDHPSYYRPISTLSLLGEEPMLIGSKFRTVKASTFKPVVGVSVPCPRRSLLVLGGNSGNIAKHCISACSGRRISITLRKQPPPDWKPDVSELVSGGDNDGVRWRAEAGQARTGDESKRKRKKKNLSGSAKRRKKAAALFLQRQRG